MLEHDALMPHMCHVVVVVVCGGCYVACCYFVIVVFVVSCRWYAMMLYWHCAVIVLAFCYYIVAWVPG